LRVSVSICGNFQTGEANETLTYSKALKYWWGIRIITVTRNEPKILYYVT
jgi:hypothetical protein